MVLFASAAPPCRKKAARPPFRLRGLVAHGLSRHPVWTTALFLLLSGAGMLAAVAAATLVCVLPLGLLLGWY